MDCGEDGLEDSEDTQLLSEPNLTSDTWFVST